MVEDGHKVRHVLRKTVKLSLNNHLCYMKFFFCCGAATQSGSWPSHSWGF